MEDSTEAAPGRRRVLIVDDEKNIRLTLAEALAGMDLQVDTSADGAEALDKLAEAPCWLMLLDIRMPGIDGMEVLRRAREIQPTIRVIIVSAHGTVENVVEAMKLGTVDFLQKPFSAQEIRALVDQVRERDRLGPEKAEGYQAFVQLARRAITDRRFDTARDHVREALALDDLKPEAHNLLGVLNEVGGNILEAQECYRTALELDPTFAPARANLQESVRPERKTSFFLGEAKIETDI